ncbi:MAG: DUF4956 domain-containing protein [Clostridia bacterium]|nr:DUF4956 domain-containing protein [Clostridia bacterium]
MFTTMLDTIFTGTEITASAFLATTGIALLLGLATAMLCMYKNKYSQSFAITLAMLPAMVAVVIMLVNGNIGAGVAVAGGFSLVRFRSAAGSAREIGMIFLAMTLGLALGMGYIALAAVFFLVMAAFTLILTSLRFGGRSESERELKVSIPENLDYEGLLDDLFERFTDSARLDRVKTTNMGTLYELTYRIVLKDGADTKAFLDEIRCRNGNLTIVCGRPVLKEAL